MLTVLVFPSSFTWSVGSEMDPTYLKDVRFSLIDRRGPGDEQSNLRKSRQHSSYQCWLQDDDDLVEKQLMAAAELWSTTLCINS